MKNIKKIVRQNGRNLRFPSYTDEKKVEDLIMIGLEVVQDIIQESLVEIMQVNFMEMVQEEITMTSRIIETLVIDKNSSQIGIDVVSKMFDKKNLLDGVYLINLTEILISLVEVSISRIEAMISLVEIIINLI